MSNFNGMFEPREETSIRFYGEWASPEAERLQQAFFDAIGLYHKLPDAIRYMDGMSGKKYRYLINKFTSFIKHVHLKRCCLVFYCYTERFLS